MIMKKLFIIVLFFTAVFFPAVTQAEPTARSCAKAENPNLARRAKASASSEYADFHSAAKAIDGWISQLNSGDAGQAWAVNGETAQGKADFTLTWKEPVDASQIIYFGRTGVQFPDECFRDVEVFLNGSQTPILKTQLKPTMHGQALEFPKTRVTSITLKFLSDYGRPNSGAAEIMVFADPLSQEEIEDLAPHISNPNLARQAMAAASSEYSAEYSAAKTVDGTVPEPFSGDAGLAWATKGAIAKGKADLTLTWKKPVDVSQLVYFGRSGASYIDEGFKDVEVYLNDSQTPVLKTQLLPIHGPQRLDVPKTSVTSVTLKFLSDYGRLNSGAAEIMAFAKPASDAQIQGAVPPSLVDEFVGSVLPEEIIFCTRKHNPEHWYANFGYFADNVYRKPYHANSGGALYAYNVKTKTLRTILEDKGGMIRDPNVHYDAQKILFSYCPSGQDHYRLYEINIDGTGLKQLTGIGEDAPEPLVLPKDVLPNTSPEWRMEAVCDLRGRDFAPPGWDDYEAAYLPDDSIVFCSTRAKRYVGCWLTHVGTIYKCAPDGSNIQMLSCNVEQDNTPWVLPNGQILYMRWEYVDRSQVHYHHLWTMNQDGTRQMILFGNLNPGGVFIDAKPIPGSQKIVCSNSPGHGRTEHYGRLAVLDPGAGPDKQESLRNITRDANHSDPWAFDEEHFMTASGDRIMLINAQGQQSVLFQLPKELREQGYKVNEPRPLMKRERERPIMDQTDYTKDHGTLAMVNLYKGRKLQGVKPGTVKKLLIYETLPKPIHYTGGTEMMSIFGTFTLERLLGSVPVSEDGSAYFKLPANRPVLFLAMDEKGHCVKRMHSFVSVMPGENTVCIGCHEERTLTPNADDRDKLARIMYHNQPSEITPITDMKDLGPDFHGVFDFPRDIQPILDKHCVECHNTRREEGGVNLSGHWTPMYTLSYTHLTWKKLLGDNRNRAVSNFDPYEIGTGSSRLVKLIEEGHQGVKMPAEEQAVIRYWIDAGANFAGTYAAEASGGVGYYMANIPVWKKDTWPEQAAMQEAVTRRCFECHGPADGKVKKMVYDIYSDNYSPADPRERKDMTIARDLCETNTRFSRMEIFDLSYPAESKALLAPLSKSAGGLGVCETKSGKAVFESTQDADYQTILAGIQRGRDHILNDDNRYSMLYADPNNGENTPQKFKPRWAYLREMIRYGILPADTDPAASYNPFTLDEQYWRSFWFVPEKDGSVK